MRLLLDNDPYERGRDLGYEEGLKHGRDIGQRAGFAQGLDHARNVVILELGRLLQETPMACKKEGFAEALANLRKLLTS